MPSDVKVAILEIDGTEYDIPVEHKLLAEEVPFDNSSNGYDSTDVQAAIEESKNDAVNLQRFTLSLIHNGTLSDGQAVRWSGLNNNAEVVIPAKSVIREITFSNTNLADADFRFYKNTVTAPNLFFTWTAIRSDKTKIAKGQGVDFTSPTFNSGDIIEIRFDKQGTNTTDLVMALFWQTVE